jgi:SM-20-related protein
MENNPIYQENIPSFEGLVDQMAMQDFGCIENFLSEQEVVGIRQLMEDDYARNRLKKAGIGQGEEHQVNRQIRGDYIRCIYPQQARPPVKALLVRLLI